MQGLDFFVVTLVSEFLWAEPKEGKFVVVGFDGEVEIGGNEDGVLDYGFPCFADTDTSNY